MFYAKRDELSVSGSTVKYIIGFYTKRDRLMFLSKNQSAEAISSKQANWSKNFGPSFVRSDKSSDMTYFVKVAG